jgi:ABC-2 type transport system permease protein
MRAAVFDHIDVSAETRAQLDPPITWWGWEVPEYVQLGVVAVVTVALIGVAVSLFDRSD